MMLTGLVGYASPCACAWPASVIASSIEVSVLANDQNTFMTSSRMALPLRPLVVANLRIPQLRYRREAAIGKSFPLYFLGQPKPYQHDGKAGDLRGARQFADEQKSDNERKSRNQ